jgi:ankyrin repeat protein
VIKRLLGTSEIQVDLKDSNGRTPLWLAVYKGYTEIVVLFLNTSKMNANPNGSDGRTVL